MTLAADRPVATTPGDAAGAAVDVGLVKRSVLLNQALWTAGDALTTGAFLTYFARESGATNPQITLLLVVPETVGLCGFLARALIRRGVGRRGMYLTASLLARAASLGIPAAVLLAPNAAAATASGTAPGAGLWLLVAALAVSQAFQAVAYVAYLSWLADLVPEHRWGRFFALRDVVKLLVLLTVPVAAGLVRDTWKQGLREGTVATDTVLAGYVAFFAVGAVLQCAALLPLRALPDVPTRAPRAGEAATGGSLVAALRNSGTRLVLVQHWWLALANGLTQAAVFHTLYLRLNLGLASVFLLQGLMNATMLPTSVAAGFLGDHFGHRGPLLCGLWVASSSMLFWVAAGSSHPGWLVPAYVAWGFFGAVNVSGRNLLLMLSPRSDNTVPLSLLHQVSGLLAGLSGLLGGFWLDHLRTTKFAWNVAGFVLGPFEVLFLASFVGRATAPLWLLPLREPGASPPGRIVRALRRWWSHRRRPAT
jgi:MFS family permease